MVKKAAEQAGPDAPDDREQTVIRMYQEGYKLADITRETHVPRATIYWLLKRAGVSTNRIATAARGDSVSASELLDRLREAQREADAYREKCIKLEALVDYLSTFTQAVRPPGDGATRSPSRPRTTGRK